LAIAKEVLSRLEVAGDHRPLTQHKDDLRREMKFKILGPSLLHHTIARQESQIIWLREGEAPTQFFHTHANAHRHRNHIDSLQYDGHALTIKEAKVVAFYNSSTMC
jgi:hypothetical protein